jgi:hypothetical protein
MSTSPRVLYGFLISKITGIDICAAILERINSWTPMARTLDVIEIDIHNGNCFIRRREGTGYRLTIRSRDY